MRNHKGCGFSRVCRTGMMAALLTTTSLHSVMIAACGSAQAQTTGRQTNFNIAAGPLSRALASFGQQAGIQVTYLPEVAVGKNSLGVVGAISPSEALARLLQGSGLSYRFTNASTVTISAPAGGNATVPRVDGAITLDVINVSGGGRSSPADAPYQTPAPTAHISQENIERFRGSSPADIFRGTPGVMSGEARNGAGGIDVNIRGMQGVGRVAVTVDGAENSLNVYQGYQGQSSRTFVDPDLLAGVDILKGSDASSRAIAGTVAMRTFSADDIVKPGEKWGVRVKGGFGTNTSTPVAGATGGYAYANVPNQVGTATPSAAGMDRPAFLSPTSGSTSAIAAIKEENYDLLWGYAYRKQGNYYAGKNGRSAKPAWTGPRPDCYSNGFCYPWSFANYVENGGLTNYRAGEEVLNTQLETESWLAKGTLRFENGHSLQLGYTGFRSEAGDLLASRFTGDTGQPVQQAQTAGTKLDTGTLRYRWKPVDNDLVDLKANFWLTSLELRNPRRGSPIPTAESLGLPSDFRTGSGTRMWGGDVTNKSAWSFDYGAVDLTYGLSYLNEDTRPSNYTNALEGWLNLRDGKRDEAATFGKVAYKPFDWLTLNGGLRYSHFWSDDRRTEANSVSQLNSEPRHNDGGFSPSAGVTVEPVKGTQLYVNYSNALRFPSLVESVSAFTLIVNENVRPERASNWDAGVNVIRDGLFAAGDQAMLKFGYFNWDISNYIAREYATFENPTGGTYTGMQIYNIDRARFTGLEFSSRYQYRGFTAELGANYYLGVEFCRTAATCESKSIYSDYATNQVPPRYSANLTVSQKLFDDALTVGGRASYIGPRAIGHGAVTAVGAAQFIEMIQWRPYWLADVFAEYKIDDTWTASVRVENLFDQYYVDPLSLVNQPGPGRTFYASLTGQLSGTQSRRPLKFPFFNTVFHGTQPADWGGFYAGAYAGASFAHMKGTATALDGTAGGIPATESIDSRLDGQPVVKDRLYGGQIGFNYQFNNNVVVGVEADYSWLTLNGSRDVLATEGSLADAGNLQAKTSYDFDWMATVRGRAGYAFDNGLYVYATGGAAFLRQDIERTQYRLPTLNDANTVVAFTESDSATRTGYALGGGAEYDIGGGWSLKGEFLFARFGQKETQFANARAGVMPDTSTTTVITPGTSDELNFDDPNCLATGFTAPGCIIPGRPPVTQTTVKPGSFSQAIGRKILSKIDIPMIKIGLSYRF